MLDDRAVTKFPDVNEWPDLTSEFGTLVLDFDDVSVDMSGPLRITKLGCGWRGDLCPGEE